MNVIKAAANYLWLHLWEYRANERRHKALVRTLAGQKRVRVVFMAVDLAYWRYQHLYELMAADERFDAHIVLSPCLGRQNQASDMERLRQYFNERNTGYVDYDFDERPFDIRGRLNPDIIFFAQPYEHLLCPEHDCMNFYDRLVCYMPYAFWTAAKFGYNLHFCNHAWRLYYPVKPYLEIARRRASNRGRNVRIVGYANADDYLQSEYRQVWKVLPDGKRRKRIVWAPHFTINHFNGMKHPRSNFLWMAPLMVNMAREYSDRLQIAFKPHPTLLSQLYEHPDWGPQRTDEYYKLWQTMENTQLETGAFADLFMTSDAMIHDSGSFVVEYLYSKRPVMYISKDLQPLLETQSEFGRQAFRQAYNGSCEQDIRRFIDDVVLGGNDPMLSQREQFFSDYLLPPGGKSVAQHIVDDITESLDMAPASTAK